MLNMYQISMVPHGYHTRTAVECRHRTPPELRRTSAIKRVRFTQKGRRTARHMCLPDRDVYAFYFTTSRSGVTLYHIDNFVGDRRIFDNYEHVPEHHFVGS